jgi:hypothetical protein
MNTPGADFLVYLKQATEQVYKTKKFWWQIDQRVKTTQCIRRLHSLVYFSLVGFFVNQARSTSGIFINGKSRLPNDECAVKSRLHSGDYTKEWIMNTNNFSNI